MTSPQAGAIRCFANEAGAVREATREEVVGAIRGAPSTLEAPADRPLVWIDITAPGPAEAAFLRDELGMHPLAVEDCLRGRQRPKLDRYPGYFFLVFYAARLNADRDRMSLNEIHVFIGSTFLITVHDQQSPEVEDLVETWREHVARLSDSGAVAHALLDVVMDGYFPVLEHFADRLERLEDRIFAADPEASIHDAIRLRHEMVLLRRLLVPERDVLASLVRRDLTFLRPELVPYFQDVHDHVLRITEELDALRDLLTGLIEVHTSNAANRLNQTMRMLTAWSIILMSVTVVAGIYGMNFVVMPELNLSWGYYGALGLMTAVGAMLALFFHRRDWL